MNALSPRRHAFTDPAHIVTHAERIREKVLDQIEAGIRCTERLETHVRILDGAVGAAQKDPDWADHIELQQQNARAEAAADLLDAGTTLMERRLADALDMLLKHGRFITDEAKAAARDARQLAQQAKEARL